MAIIQTIQRLMKGLTRAGVESASTIKELGVVEDAEQPEVIYKKSDSSGYLHIPFYEWLSSTIDNKGGSRLIGVEDDTFSVLTGDTTIQAMAKALDTYLNTTLEASGSFVVDQSGPFGGTSSETWTYQVLKDRVWIETVADSYSVVAGFTPSASLVFVADSDFDVIKPLKTHTSFATISINGTFIDVSITVAASSNITITRLDGNNFTEYGLIIMPSLTFEYSRTSS